MATTSSLLKLTTILSLLASLFMTQMALSTDFEDDEDQYILDAPFANTRLRSRFLASIKKGTQCDPINNVCNGVSANNGTSILYCCKKHCRNVLRDKNNCGQCLHKCSLGEICCQGTCTNIAYDPSHCGDCDDACAPGLKCVYGTCGYA